MKKHSEPGMRVSVNSILVNTVLAAGKLIAGLIAHSGAMISDAIHSASDMLSTFVVIIGIKLSAKASDERHPYGHERLECVCAIVLCAMLLFTGLMIGYGGIKKIISGADLEAPGRLALYAAVISIAAKEWMYHYTRRTAKKLNSSALMADAWHHRSDALSSVGSFAGILGARLGVPVLDPLASVIICIFIIKVSIQIFADSVSRMTDTACDPRLQSAMLQRIIAQAGVIRVDFISTRLFGSKMYVDVEIAVDGDLSLRQAHEIAEAVHLALEKNFPGVKHCMVHVNPA